MSATSEPPAPAILTDLTTDEFGDMNLWIGKGQQYRNVPNYVSDELCRRTSALPTVTSLLPPPSLPVLLLLDFAIPPITRPIQGVNPKDIFSCNNATHTSSECLQLPFPSRDLLNMLRAHSGQAMLDGKISIQHWEKRGIFLPFDALGAWALIVEVDTAKRAWSDALMWVDEQRDNIPAQSISRVMTLLRTVPWKDHIKGLGSGLSITDMATFLSPEWLSDTHLDTMVNAAVHFHHESLSRMVPHTEIVQSDFAAHILTSPLLETTPITHDYMNKAPQSVIRLGSIISSCSTDIRVVAVAFSPPGHWACLLIDFQARTIAWGDSMRRDPPAGFEKRLRTWLGLFCPQNQFSALQQLPCACQTDAYSCGVITINTMKHHVFGDKLWTKSSRERLRVSEFLSILEFSESHRIPLSMITEPTTDVDVVPLPPAASVLPSPSHATDMSTSDLSTSIPSSPLVLPTAKNIKRSLSPSNLSATPARKKHPRTLAYPPAVTQAQDGKQAQVRITVPTGTSKQALSKRKANESIHNGTFVRDMKRWNKYKKKLAELDPEFEVDESNPSRVRYVKHSVCGGWYLMAAPYEKERFKQHVKDCSYSTSMGSMKTLERFGVVVLPASTCSNGSSTPSQSSSPSESSTPTSESLPCPGLTERDSIYLRQYFTRTSVASAGGTDLHTIARSLFSDEFKNLSSDKKELVRLKQKQTHCWSVDHLMKTVHALGKKPCEGDAQTASDGSLEPCKACKALLTLPAFKKAIMRKPAPNENRGYIPHIYQPAEIGKMYSLGFSELINGTSSHSETLTHFVGQVVAGNFDDKPVFLDLVQVITGQAERRVQGRGLQNMKYPPAFDDWCHELLCIRPEAYRSFRQEFAGRTERSFLDKRSKSPGFRQGISPQVLERALKYLEDYRYPVNAPLALSVDDTKLLPAFRPYYDKHEDKWFLVGNAGNPLEIADVNTLASQIERSRGLLATKLRLWVLQIPLPHVPPLILAVIPLASSTDATALADMEQHLLDILLASEKSLCIISLGSDGSVIEREARRILVHNGFAKAIRHTIPHPNSPQSEAIKISLLYVHGRYIAVTQDPKHCHKTGRNNLFSGARLLILGNFPIYYEQIQSLASKDNSPLYWRDVDRLDRQDDRAAARLFSAPFLQYCVSQHGSANLGLPIYLFVIGELIDAYENRNIPHAERVKMVLRMLFFKEMWKSFLQRSGYPENRYFISAAADDIIDILVEGLIGLVFIHRDHLDTVFPLLPWMHGSEANKHIFGLLRSLIPDFTMLDVLRMIPKLNVRLMAACKAKNIKTDFRRTAAGYSHTYFDAGDIPLGILSEFPSDHEITQASVLAFDEASTLWDILGYYHASGHTPVSLHQTITESATCTPVPDEDGDSLDEPEDTPSQAPDRRALQDALDSSNQLSGLDSQAQARLNEYTYAAACLNFADQERIESLPDGDPNMQAELMQRVLEILMEVENLTPAEHTLVQDNLTNIGSHSIGSSTGISGQPSTLDPTMESESFSELSTLVHMRFKHQSEEEASSVRVARTGGSQGLGKVASSDSHKLPFSHKLKAAASPDSERQQLSQKINEIVKASSELAQTGSTGLNRRNRWTTEKAAAGSFLAGSDSMASGNTANAQAAARRSANGIVKLRANAFAPLKNTESLASAKIGLLVSLTNGCFGLAVVDDNLVLVEVLTMYEKSGAKNAKHSWTSSTTSIGALSYLAVRCYQHIRQRQFRTMECMATRTMRFAHLSSLAFLCIVPPSMVRRSTASHFLELLPGPFENIFQGLNSDSQAVLTAVRGLLRPSRRNRMTRDFSDVCRAQKSTHVMSISGARPLPGTMSTYEARIGVSNSSPCRYDTNTAPQCCDINAALQRYDAAMPTQHHGATTPTQRYSAATSMQRCNTTTLQRCNTDAAPRRYDTDTAPRRYDTDVAPQCCDINTAPQHYDAATPTRHHGATTPTQRRSAMTPTQRHSAATSTQRRNATTLQHCNTNAAPWRYDTNTAPRCYDTDVALQRYDANAGPQCHNTDTALQRYDTDTDTKGSDVHGFRGRPS
ncbi:hypothetical protein H4582DRAFT_2130928 [Lactarius indigo]|nr:hypothetical protein H4582DRAFT_2130928 [Lactarius indigo]